MAAGHSSHCSPSRSSLSCCQVDNSSQNDVNEVCSNGGQVNNNYYLQEKHQFPKRPEIDLQFQNIKFRVKSWSLRKLKPGWWIVFNIYITLV